MNRFAEPSTWAGIATLAQMLAAFLPPQYAIVAHAVTGAAGGVAVVMKEKSFSSGG